MPKLNNKHLGEVQKNDFNLSELEKGITKRVSENQSLHKNLLNL